MRVYLFRGLFGGVFSTGMDQLAEKLNADGHVATVHSWKDRAGTVEPAALAQGPAGGPVACVGHSLGGNSASYMAHSLLAAGIPVPYVATVDPTAPKPAPAAPTVSDNFRSSDPRDEPVPGANEFLMPHLNHIQIDKDAQVHDRIRAQLRALDSAAPVVVAGAGSAVEPGVDIATADPLAAALKAIAGDGGGDVAALAPLIADVLASPGAGDAGSAAALRAEVADAVTEVAREQALTPVNAALGKGLGKMLNGRKTAFGIIGLLGTAVLPILFPQLAPFQALVGTGSPIVSETPNLGQSLLTPIFSALTGWGVLGKIEKWVKGRRNR